MLATRRRSPRAWARRVALVIDGGPIHGGPASTVVDCTWDLPVIRRDGAIPAERSWRRWSGRGCSTPSSCRSAAARRARRPGAPISAARPVGQWPLVCQRPEPEEVSAVSQATVSSAAWAPIAEVDPELWAAMEAERHRQTDKIELIASENYVYRR